MIYTRTGDKGQTALLGGVKASKDDQRIRSYGSVDELNAALGIVLAEEGLPMDLSQKLGEVQNELFLLGAELATPPGKDLPATLLGAKEIKRLENEIDEMEEALEPLKNFILPGGVRASALLHSARTICRRAERETVSLDRKEELRGEVVQYLNRLGDHLFVCARLANKVSGKQDVLWISD